MADYYLYRNEENQGPYPEAQLKSMIAMGEVKGEELIFEVNGTEWVPASSLGEASSPSPAVTVTPAATQQPITATTSATASSSSPSEGNVYNGSAATLGTKNPHEMSTRPGGITFVAWMQIILGALAIIIGLLTILIPSDTLIQAMEENPTADPAGLEMLGPIIGVYKIALSALFIIIGAVNIFAGKGLLAGKSWAWIVSLIVAILGIINLNPFSIAALIVLLLRPNKTWCKM